MERSPSSIRMSAMIEEPRIWPCPMIKPRFFFC
jgi:hypothetical protein